MPSFLIDPVAALAKIIGFHAQGLRDDTDNARVIADSLLLPIIVCSRDFTYRWVSKEVARVLGGSPDEIIGRRIIDVIGEEAFGTLRPKLERVLAGEYVEDDERLYGTSADWRWIHVVYAPTFGLDGIADGWVSLLFDFDEQRRAIERLQDNEARLRKLVDTLPAIVWLGDAEGESAFVNKTYAQYIGISDDQATQRSRSRVHPDDLEGYIRGYEDAVKRRADWHAVFRMLRYDGIYRWFEVKAVPRFEDDRFVGYTGCTFDITERKVAEEALLEANRQKEEFIAVLGHELRNPLGAVNNAVAVLDKVGGHWDAAVRAREIIRRQLGNLSRLMDDLLDHGRLAADKIQLIRQPTNLADSVTRSIQALQQALRTQSHALDLKTEPAWVEGDPVRLEQIVTNLLDNAIKFTPRHGSIRVSVRGDNGRALLTVTDSGVGIPQEFLPRLFQPFAQVKPAFSGQSSGLGLGLALVKQLVEMHGGEITATSEGPGRGSSFAISLPLISEPRPMEASPVACASSTRRRVLIVEDNEDNRTTIHELLKIEGHEVLSASDGPQAIEYALALAPEVALVDLALPTWDGYEVARRLRQQFGPTIRLIALTGFGRDQDKTAADAAGFDDFLVKPADPERLLELLQNT